MTEPGEFRELQDSKCVIAIGGSPITGSGEIAEVLREIDPSVYPYADYLAALLTGEMNEVPVTLDDGSYIFASREFPTEFQFTEVLQFLRVPNMLRAYYDIPLREAMSLHKDAILELTTLVARIEAASPEFATMLGSHVAQAKRLTGRQRIETSPYQVQHLDDLANSGEWQDLAEASRRYLNSTSEDVRIAARRRLSWALLRSEEEGDRTEGFTLANGILKEQWASFEDYTVASSGALLLGEVGQAVSTAAAALENWPSEPELRGYCRTLAVRTGSQILAELLNRTGVNDL